MLKKWSIHFLIALLPSIGAAQTAEILPTELTRIPVGEIGDGVYWQQLVITLEQDDAPADSTVSVVLPQGIVLEDTDLDEEFSDEVRVMYAPVGEETPEFFVSPFSTSGRIVVGSVQTAAAGGKIYLQYPIAITPFQELEELTFSGEYGQVRFNDPNSLTITPGEGPSLTFVSATQFDARASMNLVPLGTALVGVLDTATTALGTWYPDVAEALALQLPDLVFDSGVGTSSNLLPGKDGDDSNDMEYRFFLSPNPGLQAVDSETAFEVLVGEDSVYRETERQDEGLSVRMLLRDVPVGTYFLYVTANVTGRIPLARSRGIFLRHQPQISELKILDGAITLDSGEFFNAQGEITGEGRQSTQIEFAVVDHDDTANVHLFYSEDAQLLLEDVQVDGTVIELAGATQIGDGSGLQTAGQTFTWDILEPQIVAAGNYYIYAVASDSLDQDLQRSEDQVRVQHSPLLRLDVLDDKVRSGATIVSTGGLRPQRFLSLTWGRNGFSGDEDIDDNARIALYYSEKPATREPGCDCYTVLSGADELLAELGEEAFLIAADLLEDPDLRQDNMYSWDLWALMQEGGRIPEAGKIYYIYAIIEDDNARRLVQMHGRNLNDAGSRVNFVHDATLLPLQPVADISVGPGGSGRVAWEDMDLDDDARIRILLSEEDHGTTTNYAAVAAGTAYVVNSTDGRAAAPVDSLLDLSEDSDIDHFDVSVDHITTTVDSSAAFGDGDYFVYLAISQSGGFDSTSLVWRTPGRILVRNMAEESAAQSIRLLPEILSIGTSGVRQQFDLVIDVGGQSVDQVSLSLKLPQTAFAVVDQDDAIEGIQPFFAGDGFSSTQIFINKVEVVEGEDVVHLLFDYFDPTAPQIANLDGQHILASMELLTLAEVGISVIELEVDEVNGRVSSLLHDGQSVLIPQQRALVEVNQVAGKATLSGFIALEGRTNISSIVDFSLRQWGSYTALQDSAFAATNDEDLEREGVQVALGEDGSFTLEQVPTGRVDLYAHLDGYLDAWVPALELYDGLTLTDIRPTSTGVAADSLMLGGDVAGYTELDGQTSPDNEVTLADWDFIGAFFLPIEGGEVQNARADITGDGEVGIADLTLVGANFRADGPRPVYKATAVDQQQAQLQISLDAETIVAGQEVELAVVGTGLAGVRAYEMDLTYDPRQWRLVDIGAASSQVLALHRSRDGGVRLAATQVGRGRDFSGEDALVKSRLQALSDHPTPPLLQSVALLDQQHRAVDVHILDKSPGLPQAFDLQQNYPNPFNPETAIPFAVPAFAGREAQPVQLEIFNILGQQVATLWNAPLTPGTYRMTWDGLDGNGRPVGSGVYLYRLRAGGGQWVKRMILLR